jgi:ADP-heptose:LPS heptosyltransferase
MVGDQSDAEMAERLRLKVKQESDLINLCGKISLCEVKMLIDKARLFIGSDSSINHIASATNTPSISLFGPMTPSQVQQIGENKLHIYHKYPCSPCLQKKCVITNSFFEAQCMQDITVHEILNLADRLLTGEIFNPKSQPEPANNGESFYPGIKSLTGRVI